MSLDFKRPAGTCFVPLKGLTTEARDAVASVESWWLNSAGATVVAEVSSTAVFEGSVGTALVTREGRGAAVMCISVKYHPWREGVAVMLYIGVKWSAQPCDVTCKCELYWLLSTLQSLSLLPGLSITLPSN